MRSQYLSQGVDIDQPPNEESLMMSQSLIEPLNRQSLKSSRILNRLSARPNEQQPASVVPGSLISLSKANT